MEYSWGLAEGNQIQRRFHPQFRTQGKEWAMDLGNRPLHPCWVRLHLASCSAQTWMTSAKTSFWVDRRISDMDLVQDMDIIHIVSIIIHILSIYYPYIIHIWSIYYPYSIHYYPYIIHILSIYYPYIIHILSIYYPYIIHILSIYYPYIIHILSI